MISLGLPLKVSEGMAGIKPGDLFKHICVVGGTGKGKSTYLLNLIKSVDGAKIILDPNGSLAELAYALHPQGEYITKYNPISLNPLTREHLSISETSNELVEVLETATKVTNQDQVAPTVLMSRIVRNSLRIGIKDLKKLSDFYDYEKDRAKYKGDKFWHGFDDKDSKGWYVNREMRDSAKRISARLSLLTDDEHLYPFVDGKNKFNVADIAEKGSTVIFNFHGLDDFLVAFLGGLIATSIKSYHLHQATNKSKPLFFFVDEVHLFFSPLFSRFLAEARKYNIGVIMSLHTYSQVSKQFADMIDANCYVRVGLKDKFKANIMIGENLHHVLCDPPPDIVPIEPPPPKPKFNFLKEAWINL